jgi:GDP-mannose transporter
VLPAVVSVRASLFDAIFNPEMSQVQITFAALGYMACSSLMLIGNKLAVYFLPAPSFILWSQLAVSAGVVWLLGMVGVIKVDALTWAKSKAFGPVALVFVGTIFANMKTLQYANVETFIVFRASTPIAIAFCDYLFLGRELPSAKSWACLGVLLGGAIFYVRQDSAFEVKAYFWVAVWYFIFVINQVYIKYVVDSVQMDSNWGRVYYSNFIAAIPLVFIGVGTSEQQALVWTPNAIIALLFSCALGVAMSYFAFMARKLVSATYFAIIGNACKFITIIINYFIWDKHASPMGLTCLCMCLGAAYFYKQAPLRAKLPMDDPEAGVQLVKK